MDYETIYEPNPADDVPYTRPRWLHDDGVYLYCLGKHGVWQKTTCGPFGTEADALEYLQTHWPDHHDQTLRIVGTIYHVRADGLYVLRNGYRKLEGVQP